MLFRCLLLLTTALISLAAASQSQACACCASTGQRHVDSGKIGEYEAGELRRVAFAGKAQLLTGEAEVSEIRGLSATTSEYDIDVSRQPGAYTFTFKTGGAVAGTLAFAPDKLAKFEVDTRMAEPPANGMVTLYKEWKQTAEVTGAGMFKLPKGSALSLILQGSGNGCTSAEDFRHWALVAQGNDAQGNAFSFQFFGELAKPAPP